MKVPNYKLPPKTIAYQKKLKNRRILNEDKILKLLSKFGKVINF